MQVSGEETDRKLTALAQAAGLEVEADRNRREGGEEFNLAKLYADAVGAVAQLRGAESEGVAGCGRHASLGVSKEKPPAGVRLPRAFAGGCCLD